MFVLKENYQFTVCELAEGNNSKQQTSKALKSYKRGSTVRKGKTLLVCEFLYEARLIEITPSLFQPSCKNKACLDFAFKEPIVYVLQDTLTWK